ncbi:ATP-binding cassette domain-containing protein [Paenibacillus alkaliterrae]|uniref:ATP-binding cassette domain-containing protein n=1 Tax=Paenibacillus alkaliterrae TaxID=320909 RepID=UPI001F34904C|nr:ATP-binding cassette domain-containing protein [Paenibacillus alkaliterrae]MCF2937922.1 ATP-binding cassette domain-containing protein [Paenibacillus alkaliterrae]
MNIRSKIVLPEAYEIHGIISEFDVEIELNPPQEDCQDQFTTANYRFDNGRFLFHVPETAFYSITSGAHITITPYPGADEAKIRLFLLGTCMGVLLMQRGILPLHGSAVVIDGKVYAIVGESGAGKSTLAAAFARVGYPLMTDDVIAVSLSNDSSAATVYPSYPQQKLWEESIEQLGLLSQNYSTIYQRVNKYAVPIQYQFYREPLPLAGVVELTKVFEPEPSIKAYNRLEGLHVLNVHTYRNSLLHLLNLQQWQFQSIARLASQLPVYQLRRPVDGFSAFNLVDQIVSLIHKEEVVISWALI